MAKCSMCKVKAGTWPRMVNGKKKDLCNDCKDYYPKVNEVRK